MTPTSIIKKVSEITGIRVSELKGKSKKRTIVEARQIAMVLIRKTGKSQEITGAYFNRDHATVAHAEYCVKEVAPKDEDFQKLIDKIHLEIELN